MSVIPPSPNLLIKYNSQIQEWADRVIETVPWIKNNGIPKWVQNSPRVHKIIGPLMTWMPMIMVAGTMAGGFFAFEGHVGGWVAVLVCFFGSIFSLPFIEVNEGQWCDIKYDWEKWQKDAQAITDVINSFQLQHGIVEQALAEVLELRNGPLNAHQKPKIDYFISELQKIADDYNKENNEYILNAVEASKNMTVSVQTPSILDNFGQGTVNTQLHHEQQG